MHDFRIRIKIHFLVTSGHNIFWNFWTPLKVLYTIVWYKAKRGTSELSEKNSTMFCFVTQVCCREFYEDLRNAKVLGDIWTSF